MLTSLTCFSVYSLIGKPLIFSNIKNSASCKCQILCFYACIKLFNILDIVVPCKEEGFDGNILNFICYNIYPKITGLISVKWQSIANLQCLKRYRMKLLCILYIKSTHNLPYLHFIVFQYFLVDLL